MLEFAKTSGWNSRSWSCNGRRATSVATYTNDCLASRFRWWHSIFHVCFNKKKKICFLSNRGHSALFTWSPQKEQLHYGSPAWDSKFIYFLPHLMDWTAADNFFCNMHQFSCATNTLNCQWRGYLRIRRVSFAMVCLAKHGRSS